MEPHSPMCSHGWEVVITEDHLVVTITVVLWEKPLLAEEVVRFQDQTLTDLQWENVLVSVRRDGTLAVILRGADDLAACRIQRQDLLQPLLTDQFRLLLL